jgi:hypothetical protein
VSKGRASQRRKEHARVGLPLCPPFFFWVKLNRRKFVDTSLLAVAYCYALVWPLPKDANLLLAASTLNPSASTLNFSFAACLQGFAFFQYVDVTNNDKCIAGLHGMQVWLLCSAIAPCACCVRFSDSLETPLDLLMIARLGTGCSYSWPRIRR